ncbi:hypothetical protein QBC36DRAFT_292712 [Triangularia setosa]|uniref:Ecp2 effector protein domain-containing protein n=1 Tax=Triangularia setosa TaxID=2587417 RepID=A0AAN6W377_9PEZI|nr:hypothetical protein QBC36DRAFT_292712 [Podospora setosa]
MRLASLIFLGTAANAAAVSPRNGNFTAATARLDHPISLSFNDIGAIINLTALPQPIDMGPHWSLPTEKIDCSTTFAVNNKYAYAWSVVRIQIEWIREDGPKIWTLPAGMHVGQTVRVGCCNHASINLVVQGQGKDTDRKGTCLARTLAISGAEITTMALAITDHCRSGDRTKGRAWSRYRDFTVEVYYDDWKCGGKCWQGD